MCYKKKLVKELGASYAHFKLIYILSFVNVGVIFEFTSGD